MGWILLCALALPAYGLDFVVDGDLPDGGDCAALGVWDESSNPPSCELQVFFLNPGDTVTVHRAELRLTYISVVVNGERLEIGPEGFLNVANDGIGLTNRGLLINHGLIDAADGTVNEAGAVLHNHAQISGGLSNDGIVVNVCPGAIDPPPAPLPALAAVMLEFGPEALGWCDNASGHDVVLGDLATLRTTGGDFGTPRDVEIDASLGGCP